MDEGSSAPGILGILCGVLIGLLAIFIGSGTVRWFSDDHEAPAAQHSAGEHTP